MKVNIVCTDVGWIYSKFAEMFKKYSAHEILLNKAGDVTHYIPYYEVPKNPSHPCTAWMSHMEKRSDLREKFIYAAKTVDMPISHSQKYADIIQKEMGVDQVKIIIPGVDAKAFTLRSANRKPNDKLVVGYVGRQYTSSNRKNPKLLKQISELPFVDFRTTGGNVDEKDIPKFYNDLDIVVSPATVEGGPMAIQEALAVGVPVICFDGAGVANEFGHGIIRVPFGNNKDFLSRLEVIWKAESYLKWREAGRMNQMRAQVKNLSWERFVRLPARVWESLCG